MYKFKSTVQTMIQFVEENGLSDNLNIIYFQDLINKK